MTNVVRVQEVDESEIQWLREAVIGLWDLLDDIDTAGDMAKDNLQWYRDRVELLHKRRHKWCVSDGEELYRTPA